MPREEPWVDTRGLPGHRIRRLFRFSLSQVDERVQSLTYDVPEYHPLDRTVRNKKNDG